MSNTKKSMFGSYETQYISVLKDIMEHGNYEYNERTGTYTRRLPHKIFQIDMAKEVPLLKTKKVNYKTATKEILWIMQEASNNINELDAHIWDEWADKDGFIGLAYGYQIAPVNNSNELCKVPIKTIEKPKEQKKKSYSEILAMTDTSISTVKNLNIDTLKRLREIWTNLIEGCYNPDSEYYQSYGEEGFFMCNEWLNFERFIYDVRYLPNWVQFNRHPTNYTVDPLYYGSKCFSKETCIFEMPEKTYEYEDSSLGTENQSKLLDKYKAISKIRRVLSVYLPNISKIEQSVDKEVTETPVLIRNRLFKNQVAELINNIKADPSDRALILNLWNQRELAEGNLRPCCFNSIWTIQNNKLNCMLEQRSGDYMLGVPFNSYQYVALAHLIARTCNLELGLFTHVIADAHVYENQFKYAMLQIERYNKLNMLHDKLKKVYNSLATDTDSENSFKHLCEELNSDKLKELLGEDFNAKRFIDLADSTPTLEIDKSIIDFYDAELGDFTVNNYEHLSAIKIPVTV